MTEIPFFWHCATVSFHVFCFFCSLFVEYVTVYGFALYERGTWHLFIVVSCTLTQSCITRFRLRIMFVYYKYIQETERLSHLLICPKQQQLSV